MTLEDQRQKITDTIDRLEKWVEEHEYKGYEPFDGLSSFLRPLTFNTLYGERILQQVVRQSPINLRPLFGVKPQESTKGVGYMAWGYLARFRETKQQVYKEKAIQCLDWLDRNKSSRYKFHSWGNHFDFTSRSGRLPKLEPIIVWTSLIGHAYLDAYQMFKEERFVEIAKSITGWILDLPRERTENGTCLSYVAFKQNSVHNSNMLGAGFLARASKITGNSEALAVAREAMIYSCTRQLPDGSWYYGEEPMHHWFDNFHTGYNLDSLKRYNDAVGDGAFTEHLKRGFTFFKENFFEKSGCPKYYHNRAYPIDIQCASQAIDTLVMFSKEDPDSFKLAEKVALWTIDNMQARDGHFYYRIYPGGIKAKTPMLHWGQATMYKALSHLLREMQRT